MKLPLNPVRLDDLKAGLPGVTPALGMVHYEACLVCLHTQGHRSGVEMYVTVDTAEPVETTCSLQWNDSVTEQMLSAYGDDDETTEYAAYGLAMLLILELTEYTIIRKSHRGTGFDYWLGQKDGFPFQNVARLEVSGIRRAANQSMIRVRVNEKIHQVTTGEVLPAYVIVTEFSRPAVFVVQV